MIKICKSNAMLKILNEFTIMDHIEGANIPGSLTETIYPACMICCARIWQKTYKKDRSYGGQHPNGLCTAPG